MSRSPALLLLLLAGCGSSANMASGAFGVTPGGSQDINYARDVIEAGGIPAQDQFTAEGLFSQHDLPLSGEECHEILCPRAKATPFDPVDGSGERMLVQLGFGTVVTAENFERRPLDVAVAVDISGSMEDSHKLDDVKTALGVMVDQLDASDRMALVAFDDNPDVRQESLVMDADGREKMHRTIDALQPQGGTNIEAGLLAAYEQVALEASAPGIEHRVMLMTDAQPNEGDTSVTSFRGMTAYYAEAGIGISVFGVGLDMGTELANAISHTRGGNYFYLADREDISRVFDTEFDLIVSPIAYDLDVTVTPAEGMAFAESYGAPVDGDIHTVAMGASTLFLAARDGGIGATLSGALPQEGGEKIAEFEMSYVTLDGETRHDSLRVGWDGGILISGQEVEADDVGVYKMAGLADEYLALMGAADACAGRLDKHAALLRIEAALEHVQELTTRLEDAPLSDEVQLLDQLATNLSAERPACQPEDAYGY